MLYAALIPDAKISIHTLRVEGDLVPGRQEGVLQISIHTLRVEGDNDAAASVLTYTAFQSTPSAWRVTLSMDKKSINALISIHTLRVEGDERCAPASTRLPYFNPHPPRGG